MDDLFGHVPQAGDLPIDETSAPVSSGPIKHTPETVRALMLEILETARNAKTIKTGWCNSCHTKIAKQQQLERQFECKLRCVVPWLVLLCASPWVVVLAVQDLQCK